MTITRLSIHNQNRVYWPGLMAAIAQANPANDTGLSNVYYDGQMTCYRVADFTHDLIIWYQKAVYARAPYRDYYVLPNTSYQGFRIFSQGLAEDWLRNGNVTSKQAVNLLSTTGYALNSGPGVYGEPYLQGEQGTRETAYAGMALLEAKRCGFTIDMSRLNTLLGYAKGHCDVWTNHSGTFRRPFMMALTSKFMIQYYEQIAVDSTIVTKLSDLWEDTWNTMWGAFDSFGSLSFQYTNVDTTTLSTTYTNSGGTIPNPAYNSGGTEESVNLNLLEVAPFGWLWKLTGLSKWQTRGDLIFDEGISVYNDTHTLRIRGAYLGIPSNADGKNINQNFWWSDQYLIYTGLIKNTSAADSLVKAGIPSALANILASGTYSAKELVQVLVPGILASKLVNGNFTIQELMALGVPAEDAKFLVNGV